MIGWGFTGLSGVTTIAAGENFSLARKSDGTLVAWGSNTAGEAAVLPGLSGVTAVGGGGFVLKSIDGQYSLALRSDGTVVAWGSNSSGQLRIPAAAGPAVLRVGEH